MTHKKTILCLAKSRKKSGFCVAGKEIVNNRLGGWIRPVSNREGEEISETESLCSDGSQANVLDIIEVALLDPSNPKYPYQTENRLINPNFTWNKIGKLTWEQAGNALDLGVKNLWQDNVSSDLHKNDRIPESRASMLSNSLFLIKPTTLEIQVIQNRAKKQVRAKFVYNDTRHNLSVTDPLIEGDYIAREIGNYKVNEAILCISLGEIFEDDYGNKNAYKLVAAIICPP